MSATGTRAHHGSHEERDAPTLEACSQMLQYVDPSIRYNRVRMGEALKDEFGDLAFEVFDAWYLTHGRYTPAESKQAWRSFGKGSGKPCTIRTLIYEATRNGFNGNRSHQQKRTPEERARAEAEKQVRRAALAAEAAQEHAQAAARAVAIWNAADQDPAGHEYLLRKGIRAPQGIRRTREWFKEWIDRDTGEMKSFRYQDALLIPIWSAPGKLASLQAILPGKVIGRKPDERRDKDYLTGGNKRGGYFLFGRITKDTSLALFCEGFATGASLHETTGHVVVVCFDASNLQPVATMMRGKLPALRMVVFSDRDAEALGESGGTKAALEAALATGASIVVPEWEGQRGRDANDIHLGGFTWGNTAYSGKDILEGCVKFATPFRSLAFMEMLKECGIEAEDLAPAKAPADPGAGELLEQAPGRAAAVTPARDEERRREQQQENTRLQGDDAGAMVPSKLSVDEMIENCVWIAEGRNVAYVTEDRSMFLKSVDFQAHTSESKSPIEVKRGEKAAVKMFANADLWKSDPRRMSAMTATFRPGASRITADPKGLVAVNTWRPIKRWPTNVDIAPFLDHVEYLFQDPIERAVFLDWLAHIEQKPGELPHYGWLHIAESTGTGRNWMASVLARVFRGYTAPNVDLAGLLESKYNGELAGRLLAIVDEVQEGASEGNYRHAERLKSMVNAEMRMVNNKYGMQYLEFNALRWLVFSNHKNALPLNDQDRRFRVAMHPARPRPAEVYERLYSLMGDPEFINAIGVFLRERDISSFKPGERPPLNAAKLAAIAASKPMSTQNAEEIVACWPADVITNKHVIELMTGATDKKEFTSGMRRAMEEADAQFWVQGKIHKVKIGGSAHRVWVLRDHAKWLAESTAAIRNEIARAGVDDLAGRTAAMVLADAAEKMGGLRERAF